MSNEVNNKDISTYADEVWHESLHSSGTIVDKKINTYDDIDSFVKMVSANNKLKQERELASSNEHIVSRDNTRNYQIENSANVEKNSPVRSNNERVASNNSSNLHKKKRVKLKKRREVEFNWKLIKRFICAFVISGVITTGYVSIYNLLYNPMYAKDLVRVKKSISLLFNASSVVDPTEVAKNTFDNLTNEYTTLAKSIIKKNEITDEITYDYVKIVDILKDAKSIDTIHLRMAVWAIANNMDTAKAPKVLDDYLENLGYNLIKDREDARKNYIVLGDSYTSYDDYLKYEYNNIYYDLLKDITVGLDDGTLAVDENGEVYSVSSEKSTSNVASSDEIFKLPYYKFTSGNKTKASTQANSSGRSR